MELNGACSNPRLQVELPHLTTLLQQIGAQQQRESRQPRPLGLRQGAVLGAVSSVLQRAGNPMCVREIRGVVEALLCAPIPASSVKEALSAHARERGSRFRRVSHGVYEYRRL